MKLLKTKKVNIAICWSGLKNTPPKEFPNIGEMEATANIIEALKEAIPEFVESIGKIEKINEEMNAGGDMKTAEEKTLILQNATKVEREHAEDMVEVRFENADFNTFFQQFERWGKNWFYKLEAYLSFRKEMNTTNAQPKDEKK